MDVSVKLLLASFENKSHIVNVNNQLSEIKTMVRFPKIPLPSLGGGYCDFTNFKQQLSNLAQNNDQLYNNKKLFYLKSPLKNESELLKSSDDYIDPLFKSLIHKYNKIFYQK